MYCFEVIATQSLNAPMQPAPPPPKTHIQIGQNKDAAPNLYNIREDPSEQHDLSQSHPQKLAQLLALLRTCNATAGPAHDRDPIDPRSNPQLHGGVWMPWE